ncbi:MAG: YdiY family protein [Candidatus Hydrogenedentota bacterium]
MHRFFIASCLLLATACAGAGAGDTVYLVNGDKVSGALHEITRDTIHIETPYAGALAIVREAALGINTETAVSVFQADGGVTAVRLVWDGDTQQVADEAGVRPMPLTAMAEVVGAGAQQAPAEEAPAAEESALDEVEEAPPSWGGSVESGLTVRSGNTDTTDFSLTAKLVRETADHVLTFKAAGSYGEADGAINTRRIAGEARWQAYMSDRSYLYLLGGAERDDGRKLDLRLSAALGAGYDFVDTATRTFSADLGLEYTWERWLPFTPWERGNVRDARRAEAAAAIQDLHETIAATGLTPQLAMQLNEQRALLDKPLKDFDTRREDDASLRMGAVYTQQILKHSTLSETLTLYPNIDTPGEFRGVSEFSFATPLTDVLKLSVSLRSEYDSMAGDQGVDPWDNTLVTGLRYEF